MGYGAGMEIKLNMKSDWEIVYFSGLQLQFEKRDNFVDRIQSWDFLHPIAGMSNISPDLFEYDVRIEKLDKDDREWMKKDGWVKGQFGDMEWESKPKGSMWSGYCRSSLKNTFPVELNGSLYIQGLGYKSVVVTIKPKDMEEFKIFIEDVLDFCPSDDPADFEDGEVLSNERQYKDNNDDNRYNYGAMKG